jgi:mannose-6-phosphate isomerase-like protein (cupin superfamily)
MTDKRYIANWKDIDTIEDGCGGTIYKILNIENSDLSRIEIVMCLFPPGEVAHLHYHKVMEEIYFIIEGDGEIELDGKWHTVQPEDSVAIPPNMKHRMRNVSTDKTLRFLSVNSPEWRQNDMIIVG